MSAGLFAALAATWPAAATLPCGPFTLCDGGGGGKRVSAARAEGPADAAEIAAAEAAMRAAGREPLFMIRAEDAALDAALAARGYGLVDPTVLMAAPVEEVRGRGDPGRAVVPGWPPLALMREIWGAGGTGPERLAVMARAPEPRTGLLAREGQRPGGVAFVACHGDVAMLHALEVVPALRRQGAGGRLTRAAARWAQGEGASVLALAVTQANAAARALYAGQGLEEAGRYHYRALEP